MQVNGQDHESRSTDQAGYSIADFIKQVGISRATIYLLPEDARPAGVKIGRRFIITESPAAWLTRMQDRGGITLRNTRAPEFR